MKRHHITLGAVTSAGGKVISASSMISISGIKVALDGDQIMCPACKGIGRIQCVPPRLTETCHGREVALEDDLCMCGCTPPPKLKANQSSNSQRISAVSSASGGSRSNGANDTAAKFSSINEAVGAPSSGFDMVFEVKDMDGRPLHDCAYEIELPDGTKVGGRTDQQGLTKKIAAEYAAEATITVFAPEPTPINPFWDR